MLFGRKRILKQSIEVLAGTYKHFQCESCEHYWTAPKVQEIETWATCMANFWRAEDAEKLHNKNRKCKYFQEKIKREK